MKHALTLLTALLLAPLALVHAAEISKMPPMYFGDTTRLGRPFAKDPSVIRFGGRYLLYYSTAPWAKELAPPDAPRGWAIGIAESRDLLNWKKVGEILPAQECDKNGLCAPGAIVLDGKVHLFYQTYGNGPRDAICHAMSEDGLRFTRDTSNPVFRPSGVWTVGRAIDADVIEHDERLLLYFATRDPAMKVQMIGVAAADRRAERACYFGRSGRSHLVVSVLRHAERLAAQRRTRSLRIDRIRAMPRQITP